VRVILQVLKLIAKVKLKTTREQAEALKQTLLRANECCDWISEQAWKSKQFQRFAMQKDSYSESRARFGLTAQVVIRCIAKVADAYKLDKTTKRAFRPIGSISYDDRILRWYVEKQTVSIWTLDGRIKVPFAGGEKQLALLAIRQGGSDLILHKGAFYLAAVCNAVEESPQEMAGFLGLDLGVANIATDSDGKSHSGKPLKGIRHRRRHLRTKLQKKGTRSAKRKLKKLSGRETRFATAVNHVISKQIVAKAKCTKRAIVLEELTNIRTRIKARKQQRAVLHSWAFRQLRTFIAYKAVLSGVTVIPVEAAYSSRTCSKCGYCDKVNRISQSNFICRQCGFAANADLNAAIVLRERGRALVNAPIVADCESIAHDSVASPRTLAVGY
jgi:putative transposase